MRRLCQTLKVNPSGYYAWLTEPQSARAKEDQRLLGLIKHAWLESGGVYGYRLARQFKVSEPNKVWVTEITYIRTYEGWLYLAVVLDLFSHQVIGWSMKPRVCSDLAIDAMLMAVWRRKPQQQVMIYSDSKNVLASVSIGSDSHSDRPMMDDLVVECPGWPDPHFDRPLCLSLGLSTIREHCTSR